MPVVAVSRNSLFARLGRTYTKEEFYDLCFEFGIELDDVESIEGVTDDEIYKIEISANRYDLLCLEGLARALRFFCGLEKKLPNYVARAPQHPHTMVVRSSVLGVRPVVVCAVLRDITFTEENYKSFIDLQEKLHQNICRKRTLVSIGTHDLDSIEGPFSYEGLPPKYISFVPLNTTTLMDGAQLMNNFEKDLHLGKYLHIIRDKPVYPVIYDANRVVLSLPPIINGEHSKISLKTKNVFIEVTAIDRNKALVVLDTMVTMFGEYTAKPFEVEQVAVVDESTGVTTMTPDYSERIVATPLSYLESAIGVKISKEKVQEYLHRMCLPCKIVDGPSGTIVNVEVPPTRSDVMHACDVMEDVAIGYGFNRILEVATPPRTLTVGSQQPLNKLTDQLRDEIAQAGFTEVLTLSLCSVEENFDFLCKQHDDQAVRIANPKTLEYQVGRTNLLVGILKTLQHNKQVPVPIRLFEISDVLLKSPGYDVGAKNKRLLCAVYVGTTAGFEVIHGLLDRIMLLLEIPYTTDGVGGYTIKAADDSTFFPGHCADVIVRGSKVGNFGILHPTVVANFELNFPMSALQLDVELIS